MENEKDKSILIPVMEGCKIPSVEKIVKMATRVRLKVHIAGFMSPAKEVGSMISQTIKLTKLINSIAKVLKEKISDITSKIYVNTFKKKINNVIEKENVILIATSNLSDGNIDLRNISKDVMVLQLSETDVREGAHDILLMHKIKRDNIKAITDISSIFGDRLYVVQQLNNEAVNDLTKSFGSPQPSGLDRRARPNEINEWLLKHKAGLVALNKAEVNRSSKKVMEVLKNRTTPVLLY